jgi:DNA-binding MarR family transcriptional regulator
VKRRLVPETDASELVSLIGEAFRQTRRPVDQLVRHLGITATQFGILRRIGEKPGISGAEVARQNFISSQAAQIALATLESKGLIIRRPAADQRIAGATLTKKGEELLTACRSATMPMSEKFAAPLTSEERQVFIALLQRCLDHSSG